MININSKNTLIISGALFLSSAALITAIIALLKKAKKGAKEQKGDIDEALKQINKAKEGLDLLLEYTANVKEEAPLLKKDIEAKDQITEENIEDMPEKEEKTDIPEKEEKK